MKPNVIAIVGPTASGKTGLGIKIAKGLPRGPEGSLRGEVISVDSRQIYREMDIGTAKPEGEWLESEIEKGGSIHQLFGARKTFLVEGVPHWGIDLVDPDAPFSVADFKQYAQEKIEEIVGRGKLPILVGGTGFWLKALLDNLDLTQTPADPRLRAELEGRTLGDLYTNINSGIQMAQKLLMHKTSVASCVPLRSHYLPGDRSVNNRQQGSHDTKCCR